jgi:4'-phosphopantetheinyl transferase EntD
MSRATEACAAQLRQHFDAAVLCDVVPVDGDPAALWPAEQTAIANAVASRRREFATGRLCARRLLEGLGLQAKPVPAASDRSPLWPAGAIGSIAHTATLCVVAVARSGGPLLSIGVDAEPDAPLEADLWATLCSPRELTRLLALPGEERGPTARLLFSAKECVYKCLHPVLRLPLEFHDVEVEFRGPRFRAALLGQAAAWPAAPLVGFHLRCAGSILTGMTLLAPAPAPT